MAVDYEAGEVSEREQQTANNLNSIAQYNAQSTKNQLSQLLGNYDLADQQNKRLADVEQKQNSRKAANERFAANKKLQAAVTGLTGTMGNALAGSGTENLLNMVNTRTDLDNGDAWNTLQQNQNTVTNAYNESLNSNVLSRNDAAINAEYGLRTIESDTAAQLNNVNPNLYVAPGEGTEGESATNVGATGYYDKNKTAANMAEMSGYIVPAAAQATANQIQPRNTVRTSAGGNYYSNLLNQYNKTRS